MDPLVDGPSSVILPRLSFSRLLVEFFPQAVPRRFFERGSATGWKAPFLRFSAVPCPPFSASFLKECQLAFLKKGPAPSSSVVLNESPLHGPFPPSPYSLVNSPLFPARRPFSRMRRVGDRACGLSGQGPNSCSFSSPFLRDVFPL